MLWELVANFISPAQTKLLVAHDIFNDAENKKVKAMLTLL